MTNANGKVNLAFIGLGQQCMGLLTCFIGDEKVRVVAGCDVYDIKRNRFEKRVRDYYTEKGEKKVKVDMYEDYKELLARRDIDAVVIATPDHQHAIIAIDACRSGKDVYLEKPMTLTIYEGRMLCKAVRKYNRILQVGSMQRSWGEFVYGSALVRAGKLGKISHVQVFVGRNSTNPKTGAPVPCKLPRMEVPKGLNWDKWLGPLPESVYYHSDLNPLITETENEKLWGAWRWYKPSGGGLMTDWGAHMFDIAQWMLGEDRQGPVEVCPGGYDYHRALTYRYDNGITMTEESFGSGPGVKIYGEEGWVEVSRGKFTTSNKALEMKEGAKLQDEWDLYDLYRGHYGMFIDSVLSRIDPNVPVETGHSSCTVCNIGNIAMELNRPLRWNPKTQCFMDDEEANRLMHYTYRDGYKLEV